MSSAVFVITRLAAVNCVIVYIHKCTHVSSTTVVKGGMRRNTAADCI